MAAATRHRTQRQPNVASTARRHVCCAGEGLFNTKLTGPGEAELQPRQVQEHAIEWYLGNRASAGLARFASRGGAAAPFGRPRPPTPKSSSAAGTTRRRRSRRRADGPQGPLGATDYPQEVPYHPEKSPYGFAFFGFGRSVATGSRSSAGRFVGAGAAETGSARKPAARRVRARGDLRPQVPLEL